MSETPAPPPPGGGNPWQPPGTGAVPPPQYAAPGAAPPRRGGVPAWAWALMGCGCLFFVVPILAAILFPVFALARVKARQVSCLANQKQMANALQAYAQDHDDRLPPASRWMSVTVPYAANNRSIYQCPEETGGRRGSQAYGFAFDDAQSGKSVAKMKNPASVRVVFESNDLSFDAHDSGTSLPAAVKRNKGRHPSGNGHIFADGHVDWVPAAAPPGP